jgi:O-6-methylguanine DNA methyltransferase
MTNRARGFTFFDTPIGRCAVGWGERGIVAIQLPEARPAETRARLLMRLPGARETPPPPEVEKALEGIQSLMRGEASDLASVVLDMNGIPPFHRRVYEMARTVPPGDTLSYGEVASRLGVPGSARAVGQALGRNPFPIVVPCHRVLAAGGKLGGFSANGGVSTKLRMLAIEGARAGAVGTVGDGDGELGFDPSTAIHHLRASDPALARLIDATGPFRLRLQKTSSVFGALAEAIVYQQLTGKAAATIFARVCALFPRTTDGLVARRVLRASDEKLRGAGLSRSKVLSLRDLAGRAEDGEIPTLAEARMMEDHEVLSRLTEVRGIGRWTAEMFLIFRLGRPDVLPVDDYGVRKGFAVAFRKRALPTREAVERRGIRWKPYRTVASWYLWRAAERSTS